VASKKPRARASKAVEDWEPKAELQDKRTRALRVRLDRVSPSSSLNSVVAGLQQSSAIRVAGAQNPRLLDANELAEKLRADARLRYRAAFPHVERISVRPQRQEVHPVVRCRDTVRGAETGDWPSQSLTASTGKNAGTRGSDGHNRFEHNELYRTNRFADGGRAVDVSRETFPACSGCSPVGNVPNVQARDIGSERDRTRAGGLMNIQGRTATTSPRRRRSAKCPK
jgi:hypothetical protein